MKMSIQGDRDLIAKSFEIISEVVNVISTPQYDMLFTNWNNNQNNEDIFKELKKFLRYNIHCAKYADSFKICVEHVAGVNFPKIKIKNEGVKITTRLGFSIVVNVKSIKSENGLKTL